jgi:hypothetical protein
MKPTPTHRLLQHLPALLLCLVPGGQAATIAWTNVAGGSWTTPANWSPNQVPADGDTVLITANGTYTVTLNASPTLAALALGASAGTQTLAVNGQSLTLAGASTVNANGRLQFDGGWLQGTGTLEVTGTCDWSYGRLVLALTVTPTGTLNLEPSGDWARVQGTITNRGTLNHAGGANLALEGGRLVNQAGGVIEVQGHHRYANYGGTPVFANAGLWRKVTGASTTYFDAGIAVENTGQIDVQAGTLNFPDGFTSSGTFSVAAGAAITLTGGTFAFRPGHAFAGEGFYGITSGSVAIDGDLSSPNFQWTNGNLTSTNQVTGKVRWSVGRLYGALTVAPGGTLNLEPSGEWMQVMGAITNRGTLNHAAGANLALAWGRLVNEAGGVIEVQGDQRFANYGGTPVFANAGVWRKVSGASTTYFEGGIAVENTGNFDVQTGTLRFPDGFTSSGTFSVAAGAAITLTGGTFAFRPGHAFAGEGFYGITSGSVAIDGDLSSPNFQWTNGDLTSTNQVTDKVRWSIGRLYGALTVAPGGTLNLEPSGEWMQVMGAITNRGTLNHAAGANLALAGGGWLTRLGESSRCRVTIGTRIMAARRSLRTRAFFARFRAGPLLRSTAGSLSKTQACSNCKAAP